MIADRSSTAFLVAYHRALESEGADAIVSDPYARALAGDRGRLMVEALPTELRLGWPIAVRTRVYDEMILEAVRDGQVDAVLSLGAGLDARPYRLRLPERVAWIEADLPTIIEHKAAVMSSHVPACSVERWPVDLDDEAARRALIARVGSEHARVFVLTEGVLAYLEERVVAALAAELRSEPAMRLWATELASPSFLAEHGRAVNDGLRAANISLRFAPSQGAQFFAHHGWRPARVLPFFDEARRLGKEPPALANNPQMRDALRKTSAYLLLEAA